MYNKKHNTMKTIKIFITAVVLSLLTNMVIAQDKIGDLHGINYQAVAIDEDGEEIVGKDIKGKPLYKKEIGVKFTITKGYEGDIQYQETHTTTTDENGLFSLVIGKGDQTGDGQYTHLLDMPWIDADQWLKVEIAIENDDDFRVVGYQQFMTVPYSFYTDDIADNAITTYKILDSAILNQDIHTGSVDSRTILDSTIINEDIHTSAVDSRTILDSTIINEDIHTGAVDSRTILDSTIINEDIHTSAVDSRTILDSTIINEDIHTGAVDSRTILDSTIINEDIHTSAVDSRTILDSTIINEDIHTGAVDSRTILDSTIINEDIHTAAVDSRTMLDSTIINEDIHTGAVDSRTILDGTIINEDIADGTIDLATKVDSVLPVANGGTGTDTLNKEEVLVGNGLDPLKSLLVNDSAMVLTNYEGETQLYKLRAGARTYLSVDSTTNTVTISAIDQSMEGGAGIGTFAIPNLNAGQQATNTFLSAGAQVGDFINLNADANLQGITMTGYVSAPDNITVVFYNGTGAPVGPINVSMKVINFGQ